MGNLPDPLPLRTIRVPPEIARVEGCDCGGLECHAERCAIRALPWPGQRAAIDAALDRTRDWAAEMSARLRDALGEAPL